jgi:uncharacterized membrane protein
MSIFSVVTFEYYVGQYHALFWFLPVILFTAALIADLMHYYGKKRAFVVAHWLVIAGVVSCIPTLLTGIAAETSFAPGNVFLEQHRYLGFATGISGSLYAGLRISAMLWYLPLKPVHYVFLSLLLVALVSWTSDYGGLIVHGQ